ncbi:probable carboxylesterase 15 [Brachypodium distachyon]|uniref:Alpha/beta hydrolase fold-3 domain-containing protein n=1 Tax=Brachypodium distachyon TaxID=15368 RepID=I1H3J4_BRADI|nr:probable carboxylesterase 15 [Brachypodium distachyon]KQK20805.1 hypothetical protein BRADI_1g56860v3 [Brachypodium distachyon]|eukprot:XP_003561402.1 probable carboxylesterase 15 [Brachypodium distachyon]
MPTIPAAGESPREDVVEDVFGLLRVLSDGTILRSPDPPAFCPKTFPTEHPSVQWKEAVYDKPNDLRVRIYKPAADMAMAEEKKQKLPVLVYFHGGGFCIGSCTWANTHSFCLRLAADAGAVVLSAGYRLAPEHRLPAALHDAAGVLAWLSAQQQQQSAGDEDGDTWCLAEVADFRRVFVTGDSAGGTLAHHLAVSFGSGEKEKAALVSNDVTVKGYVLLMPFFGGEKRTASEEAESPTTFPPPLMSLDTLDRYWRLALPAGATRDHPLANPFGANSPGLEAVELPPVLAVAAGQDMLRDRVVDYVERLKAMGKPVELVEFAAEPHGFFTLDPWNHATGELIRLLRRFVHGDAACGVDGPKTAA